MGYSPRRQRGMADGSTLSEGRLDVRFLSESKRVGSQQAQLGTAMPNKSKTAQVVRVIGTADDVQTEFQSARTRKVADESSCEASLIQ